MIVREPRGVPGFVKIPNRTARNRKISFRALGILTHVLSMPDNWSCTTDELADLALEGRDAIRTAIRELETHGYVVRTKTRNEAGQWVHNQVFRERAVARPAPDIQSPAPAAETQESAAQPDDWKPDVGRSGVREKTQRKRRPKEDQTPAATASPPAAAPTSQEQMLLDVPYRDGAIRRVGNPRASAVTKRVWDAVDPKPTGKHAWIALYRIMLSMLDQGIDDEELVAAASASPFLTRTAIEGQIRLRRQPARSRPNPDDKARDFLARNTTRYAGRTQEPSRHA